MPRCRPDRRTETAADGVARLAYVVAPVVRRPEPIAAVPRKLPEFMMPDRIGRLEHLPLTPPARWITRAAARVRCRAQPFAEKRFERIIAEVWRDVRIDDVGIDDNFDVAALLLLRAFTRLRERLGASSRW